jgi:hypothetical protein
MCPKGSTMFRPAPPNCTVYVCVCVCVWKWYTPNTWCLSRSLCWWLLYTYICDRPQRGLCSQKAAARSQSVLYRHGMSAGTWKWMKIRLRPSTFLIDLGPRGSSYIEWMEYSLRQSCKISGCGWGTMLQVGRSRDLIPIRWIFLIYLILPAALWPWGRLSL